MKLHYFHGRTPLHTLVLWRNEPRREEPVQWTVRAQRLARDLRQRAEANEGKYVFDAEQFEPTL